MFGITLVVVKQKDNTFRGVFWDGDPEDGNILEKINSKNFNGIFTYGVNKYIDGQGRTLNIKKIGF